MSAQTETSAMTIAPATARLLVLGELLGSARMGIETEPYANSPPATTIFKQCSDRDECGKLVTAEATGWERTLHNCKDVVLFYSLLRISSPLRAHAGGGGGGGGGGGKSRHERE
jgi:hypothetical protein